MIGGKNIPKAEHKKRLLNIALNVHTAEKSLFLTATKTENIVLTTVTYTTDFGRRRKAGYEYKKI